MSAAARARLAEGRRRAQRFDIMLPLRFAVLRPGVHAITGTGQSLNISHNGMLFQCEDRLAPADAIVALLDWPVTAPDNEPLKLVLTGNVVRARRGLVGVAVHTHRLVKERDLDSRLNAFWAPSEQKPRPQRAPAPVALVEDDDTMALLVSLALLPQRWTVEQVDADHAKAILASARPAVSLLVTRTPELLDLLPPRIPAILTLPEDAPAGAAGQVGASALRHAVRKPLTDARLRELLNHIL